MLEFSTAAELRAHYSAVRKRTNAWPPPKKSWHMPCLIECRKQLFSRVVVTIQNTPVLIGMAKPCLVGIIQKMVCQYYKVGIRDLCGSSRKTAIIEKRHVAVYLARQRTLDDAKYTLPMIGRLFGGRDHTTILHAHRKISYQRLEDSKLDAVLKEFERRLGVA